MRYRSYLPFAVVAGLGAAIAGLLLGACSPAGPRTAVGPGTPPATSMIPGRPPLVQPTESLVETTPGAPAVVTLTMWTTEVFSPTQAITTGRILAQQVSELRASRPNLRVEFVLKKPYGNAGVLDYLLTTGAAAPRLLPDLVFIDAQEVETAVQLGLVQPLDERLSPELLADLYPFALDACTVDGKLYCLQFQADVDHLVYNRSLLSSPPRSWREVLNAGRPYLFPAAGEDGLVNDSFLIQYLAVREQSGATGSTEPFLDEQSLVAVLEFYADGASRSIFPHTVLGFRSTDDTWRAFQSGQAAMAEVSAHRYLAERSRAEGSGIAPIPAIYEPAAPISRGWALALITSDPERQAIALEFMAAWLSPETCAAWNQAAATLPTRQAALARRDQADLYTSFIKQQLLAARPRTRASNYRQVAAALQKAVEAVLKGDLTPQEAAAEAMGSQP